MPVKVTHIGSGAMLHQHFKGQGGYATSAVFQRSKVFMGVKVAIAQNILKS